MGQILISIGREFGSGGHKVAQLVAEHYNIPLYNKETFAKESSDGQYSPEVMEKFDEKPVNIGFVPIPLGGTNLSLEQRVAISQFNFIRKKGIEELESFVVIGRCSDEILADNPNLVSAFILSDTESKKNRVMEREGIDEKQALNKMKKVDKMRKTYHNFYCEHKWGDSRTYDLCISTSKISIEDAAKLIIQFVDSKIS